MNRTQAMQILMLDSNASFDDVKYAYRKLSLELHPDRNKNENDGLRFKNVLEAYHFLKSQSRLKNSHYDDKTTKKKPRTYKIQPNKIPQKKTGVNLQKTLKWMKTFGDNMKNHFGKIMNSERMKLKRMIMEGHFGMKMKKELVRNLRQKIEVVRQKSTNMIYLYM